MKNIGRIILALFLGFVIIIIASAIVMSLPNPDSISLHQPWLLGVISHGAMLILSTLLLLLFGKGKLGGYGFRRPQSFNLPGIILPPFILSAIANIVLSFMPDSQLMAPAGYKFWHIVVFIWLLASIAEEVYTRGLIQGLLRPMGNIGVSIGSIRITLPMIISAVYFSLLHLMAFATIAPVTLIFFLIVAFVLGLMAGYQLEKTGSLIPAIIVHAMFNIAGSVVEAVWGILG